MEEDTACMVLFLTAVAAGGLVPVIAHPERYFNVQRSPDIAQRWADRGFVLQLNKGSLLGELGPESFDTAALLLRRGAVSVIASDAHHFLWRTPHMGALLQCLEQRFPEIDPELLLRINPMRIAKDLDL